LARQIAQRRVSPFVELVLVIHEIRERDTADRSIYPNQHNPLDLSRME